MSGREGTPWASYQARLDRVIDYIHDHLDEPLDLNRLAEVACLSPYHWHRIYHAMLGETVAATVRRLRLHLAAGDLARSNNPIGEIAADHGFNSIQAFSRGFRTAFGISPGAYRNQAAKYMTTQTEQQGATSMHEVTIRDIPTTRVLAYEHKGAYMQIGRAFDHLAGWLVAHNLFEQRMRLVAIYFDDPTSVPEEDLRSLAGVVMPDGKTFESPFKEVSVGGGPHAVLLHKGPYAELANAYQWLYGQWLPHSGREARNAPPFEEYLNTPQDTPPTDLLTEICLPLE